MRNESSPSRGVAPFGADQKALAASAFEEVDQLFAAFEFQVAWWPGCHRPRGDTSGVGDSELPFVQVANVSQALRFDQSLGCKLQCLEALECVGERRATDDDSVIFQHNAIAAIAKLFGDVRP